MTEPYRRHWRNFGNPGRVAAARPRVMRLTVYDDMATQDEAGAFRIVDSVSEALVALGRVGLPARIIPAFSLGGFAPVIAHDLGAFERIVADGLKASPVCEVMIEPAPVPAGVHKLSPAEVEQRSLEVIVELLISNRHLGIEEQARAILASLKAIAEGGA